MTSESPRAGGTPAAGSPGAGGTPASAWIVRFAALVRRGGAVLDVACGGGRHARLFHGLGHPVTGIDISLAGVADLAGAPGVELIAADLENGNPWPLPAERRFAGIVIANYLHRPLFPALLGALEPGGVLLYETFAAGNGRFGKPSSPAFLLRPGELLEVARERLDVVAYEHGLVAAPRPAVVQRIAAVLPVVPATGAAGEDQPHPLPP